jgi:threonine synthase
MDVGNPSNFERLEEVFLGNYKGMASRIEGRVVSDARTVETMQRIHAERGLLVDPHTAVGIAAAGDHFEAQAGVARGARGRDSPEQVIVLSTAHPGKFSDIVQNATGTAPELPERLSRCLMLPKLSRRMGTTIAELSEFLLDSFGKPGAAQ